MKFKKWEEEMSLSLEKILLVKLLGGIEKCKNCYWKNQCNDFDET